MRNNYPGVVGFVLVILGLTFGGLAIVRIASEEFLWGVIWAVVAVVLLALGGVTLVTISKREQQDPLEPIMTEEGVDLYEQQREEGDV